MAKNNRTGGRTQKLRRRAARASKQHAHRPAGAARCVPGGPGLTGWHILDLGTDPHDFDNAGDVEDLAAPDEALLDTTHCPIADRCTSCGATVGLQAVTAAFTRPGGYDVACTTLCRGCDTGRSFLHLLGPAGLDHAFTQHATHQN